MDPSQLEPIESHLRQEAPPADATAVLRGGPLTVEKFVEHAPRQEREFSHSGRPMSSISVYLTVAGWTLDSLVRNRLWSRSTFATCSYSDLVATDYLLLPTHDVPHYDIMIPASNEASAGTLLAVFGPVQASEAVMTAMPKIEDRHSVRCPAGGRQRLRLGVPRRGS